MVKTRRHKRASKSKAGTRKAGTRKAGTRKAGRRRLTRKTRRSHWRLKGGYNEKKCNKYAEKLEKIEATKEEIERKIKNYCTGLTRDHVEPIKNQYERPYESIYKTPSNVMPSVKIPSYIPLAEQGQYASLYSPLKTVYSK